MAMNAVFQLDPLQLLGRHAVGAEIFARRDGGFLHETVRHSLPEAVIEDHVLEALGARADGTRGRGQFQSNNGIQLANSLPAGLAAITVRLVHQQNEVRQFGQIIEIALADILVKLLDAAAVLVDLIDVEDVDDGCFSPEQVAAPHAASLIPGVPGDEDRWTRSKFSDALKDILLGVWSEIRDELVVNRGVRGQYEEISRTAAEIQIADKRAHEPRFADSGREGEA